MIVEVVGKNVTRKRHLSPMDNRETGDYSGRQSDRPLQHRLGHVDCEACHAESLAAMQSISIAALPFKIAAPIWLASRTSIAGSTRFNYVCNIKSLGRFFDELPLRDIEIGHVETYKSQRKAGQIPGLRRAGSSCVNHEINTLSQIMARAGEWDRIKKWYEPEPQPQTRRGCCLSQEQERRLFDVAASNPRWFVAYLFALITVNTTAGAAEIRHLRLGDVDLDHRQVHIREGTKNKFRERVLPLNEPAFWAVKQLYSRAVKIGSSLVVHYLCPHRAATHGQKPDPTKPMGSVRTAWRSLRIAAGLPDLRYYDLRHHSASKFLSNPLVSEGTVIELMGHRDEKMLATYSHVRQESKRAAVEALEDTFAHRPEKPSNLVMISTPVAPPAPAAAPPKKHISGTYRLASYLNLTASK